MGSKGRVRSTTILTVSPLNTVSNADSGIENYLGVLDKCSCAFIRIGMRNARRRSRRQAPHPLIAYLWFGYKNSKPA